jgi:uncharacterized protein (DUF362 family)
MIGGFAATFLSQAKAISPLWYPENKAARVALTTGDHRADITIRALQPFSEEIKRAIGNRLVVLKPNNVSTDIQLAATHVDTLEGILEFLKSINKLQNVIIAESSGGGRTFDGFHNFGYDSLVSKYPVKLVDLDQEAFDSMYVFDERDVRPHACRMSRILLDRNSYVISVARMKTHNRVVATLSLKNTVFGAPLKHLGDRRSDKPIAHGGGVRGTNYNLYALARQLHPQLALIDGFEGMEGNGPSRGTPVDHRVCLASQDWLAADRVAIELMGIDFSQVGYLNFCADAGLGMAELGKIEVLGEMLANHIKSYRLPDNINDQLIWMTPLS